jgi:hypothetical protein
MNCCNYCSEICGSHCGQCQVQSARSHHTAWHTCTGIFMDHVDHASSMFSHNFGTCLPVHIVLQPVLKCHTCKSGYLHALCTPSQCWGADVSTGICDTGCVTEAVFHAYTSRVHPMFVVYNLVHTTTQQSTGIQGITVFTHVICTLFFSSLAAEKSGCVKYAVFFFS